MGAEKLKYINN